MPEKGEERVSYEMARETDLAALSALIESWLTNHSKLAFLETVNGLLVKQYRVRAKLHALKQAGSGFEWLGLKQELEFAISELNSSWQSAQELGLNNDSVHTK